MVDKLKKPIRQIRQLLNRPSEELGKLGKFVVFQARLWPRCVRLLKQNRSGQQAAALSYHTLFGIVPLAIVMLMVFQMFPAYRHVGTRVKSFFYEQVNLSGIQYPTQVEDGEPIALTQKIDEMTQGFISELNAGAITLVSALIVIWAAIGLLTTIEKAFNRIWNAERGRDFLRRLVNYWALLTLTPLLLGVGFYVSTRYLVLENWQTEGFLEFIRPLVTYAISTIAFFFLYFVLPNTKVKAGPALWGAAVAALIWGAAKWAFGMYVTELVPYNAVYGMLGLIPLTVLWIYVTWLIVLFGLQVTYTTQNLKSLSDSEITKMQRREGYFIASDFAVVKIMGFIYRSYFCNRSPVSSEDVCESLRLPAAFVSKILKHLTARGLLFQTSEPVEGYVLATDAENISVDEIIESTEKATFKVETGELPTNIDGVVERCRDTYRNLTLKEVMGGDLCASAAGVEDADSGAGDEGDVEGADVEAVETLDIDEMKRGRSDEMGVDEQGVEPGEDVEDERLERGEESRDLEEGEGDDSEDDAGDEGSAGDAERTGGEDSADGEEDEPGGNEFRRL
ncbi:ribonuclease BN/unknown domain fusion protein [Anaerohalosphaera lusitana]|uniref:YihY family inner membrane protein n=1 Tax=Anaerohalosphaera lusitana TaxID=1936003 RepID=A0A1U9NQW8_9BACT|nr:YhjD/YihY/BrkB family envelope integrity protein [Anaerohalosphaera lusitana]AQT70177.1 ribonuclease BN/unknown domain fusion protein [Anaerohalosphaera lusitana]